MRIIIIIKSGTRKRNRDSSINFTLEVMKFAGKVGRGGFLEKWTE